MRKREIERERDNNPTYSSYPCCLFRHFFSDHTEPECTVWAEKLRSMFFRRYTPVDTSDNSLSL